MSRNLPTPLITWFLQKDDGLLYLVIERVNDPDVDGELLRFRVHDHPPGSSSIAEESNKALHDETGNQHDLRRKVRKYLEEKMNDKWRCNGPSYQSSDQTVKDFWEISSL